MMWSPAALGLTVALACALAAPLRAEEAATAFDPAVARRITAAEVQKRIAAGEKPVLIDTRSFLGDTKAKGAVQVTNDKLEAWAKTAPSKDALIVTYCT